MVSSNFFDRTLDDVYLQAETSGIGESTESRIRELESLKKKLLQIEDLRPRLDDEFLLRFLRVAKFDATKACERIRKYYSIRKTYSHVLGNFYPSAAKTVLGKGIFLACPRRSADHSTVLIVKRGMCDPSKMVYEDVFLMNCLSVDFISEDPVAQVCGVHVIVDLAGYGFQHFVNDTPRRLRMAIDVMQNSFPLRYKSIHLVNAPQMFSFIYRICYPFLTKKIKNRLYMHDGNHWESLHSTISPEILPLGYGGMIPHSEIVDLTNEILSKDLQFKEQLQFGFIKKS